MIPGGKVKGPLAAPTYLTHVTAPSFRRGRAAAVAILLHGVAVLLFLAVLHHRFSAHEPDEATVALVIEPSPYVGTGPSAVASAKPQKRVRAPRRAALKSSHAPKSADVADAVQSSRQVASVHASATLPLPAPPEPKAPAAHPEVRPDQPASPAPHQGDNQPVGYGLADPAKFIPARLGSALSMPDYPRDALLHGEEGRVVLSIEVTPNGRASAVNIVDSSGYAILDRAARDAVMGWQFLPAHFGGRPVSSTLLLPVRFEIDAAQAVIQ